MYGRVKDEGMLLGRNASLEGEVKDVEGMHSPQSAHARKTQHVTTTCVGTLNILEHSFCLCIYIFSFVTVSSTCSITIVESFVVPDALY